MIHPGRYYSKIEGDFVVFLIGARINKLWKFWLWLPFMPWMPKMLKWLEARRGEGLLHYQQYIGFKEVILIQYWRSLEQLEKFASNPEAPHLPSWKWYNKALRENDVVGIWHETYAVKSGQYENIYNNMPRYGLANAGSHEKIGSSTETMAQRL